MQKAAIMYKFVGRGKSLTRGMSPAPAPLIGQRSKSQPGRVQGVWNDGNEAYYGSYQDKFGFDRLEFQDYAGERYINKQAQNTAISRLANAGRQCQQKQKSFFQSEELLTVPIPTMKIKAFNKQNMDAKRFISCPRSKTAATSKQISLQWEPMTEMDKVTKLLSKQNQMILNNKQGQQFNWQSEPETNLRPIESRSADHSRQNHTTAVSRPGMATQSPMHSHLSYPQETKQMQKSDLQAKWQAWGQIANSDELDTSKLGNQQSTKGRLSRRDTYKPKGEVAQSPVETATKSDLQAKWQALREIGSSDELKTSKLENQQSTNGRLSRRDTYKPKGEVTQSPVETAKKSDLQAKWQALGQVANSGANNTSKLNNQQSTNGRLSRRDTYKPKGEVAQSPVQTAMKSDLQAKSQALGQVAKSGANNTSNLKNQQSTNGRLSRRDTYKPKEKVAQSAMQMALKDSSYKVQIPNETISAYTHQTQPEVNFFSNDQLLPVSNNAPWKQHMLKTRKKRSDSQPVRTKNSIDDMLESNYNKPALRSQLVKAASSESSGRTHVQNKPNTNRENVAKKVPEPKQHAPKMPTKQYEKNEANESETTITAKRKLVNYLCDIELDQYYEERRKSRIGNGQAGNKTDNSAAKKQMQQLTRVEQSARPCFDFPKNYAQEWSASLKEEAEKQIEELLREGPKQAAEEERSAKDQEGMRRSQSGIRKFNVRPKNTCNATKSSQPCKHAEKPTSSAKAQNPQRFPMNSMPVDKNPNQNNAKSYNARTTSQDRQQNLTSYAVRAANKVTAKTKPKTEIIPQKMDLSNLMPLKQTASLPSFSIAVQQQKNKRIRDAIGMQERRYDAMATEHAMGQNNRYH